MLLHVGCKQHAQSLECCLHGDVSKETDLKLNNRKVCYKEAI